MLRLAALVAVVAAASAYLFVFPHEDRLTRADALVVLAGGRDERLDEGLALMRRGLARTLVISDGRAPGWRNGNRLCAGRTSLRVLCFYPRPYSTRGEARGMALLAAEHGWRSLIVVTSAYHVRRARMLFRRCFHGRVEAVASQPDLRHFVIGVAYEWPKYAYERLISRDC